MKFLTFLFSLCLIACSTSTVSPADVTCLTFKRGDANNDGTVNITDVTFISNYMSLGGTAPCNLDSADTNDDGLINVTDLVYLTNWLSLGGPLPPAPGPFTAGVDPTEDPLEPCTSKPAGANTDIPLTTGADHDAFGLAAWEKNPINSAAHRGSGTISCDQDASENCPYVWGIFENTEARSPPLACADGDKDMRFSFEAEGNGIGDEGVTLARLTNGSQKVKIVLSVLLDTATTAGCSDDCYPVKYLDYIVAFPTFTRLYITLQDSSGNEVVARGTLFNLDDIEHRWTYKRVETETGGFTCGWVQTGFGQDIEEAEIDITGNITFVLDAAGAGFCDVYSITAVSLGNPNTPGAADSPAMILEQPRTAQGDLDEASKKEWAKVTAYFEAYYEWAE